MKYLKDKIESFPKNCLLDKGKVGCGGTSMAIECDEPYVIAVPYESLVKNKTGQYPNDRYEASILGVCGGVDVSDIEDYLKNAAIPKIVTTYDSLEKVISACGGRIGELNLLIDEYHSLLREYSFRSNAANIVLQNFRKFASFTFMSATPIEEEFILEHLKGIPTIKIDWDKDETVEVQIEMVRCDSVIASALKLVNYYMLPETTEHGYIFLNSVDMITDLVKKAGLSKDDCHIVCSKNNKKRLPFPASTVAECSMVRKKLSFLTSTAFEGCDIYDPDGQIVIVSDPRRECTLLDISTSVNQIVGRIRDSKHMSRVKFFFKESHYAGKTQEEFEHDLDKTIKMETDLMDFLNKRTKDERAYAPRTQWKYVENEDGIYTIDMNKVIYDKFCFSVMNRYTKFAMLADACEKSGMSHSKASDHTLLDDIQHVICKDDRKSFKDTCIEIKGQKGLARNLMLRNASGTYPFISDAFSLLGFKTIASLGFSQRKIKELVSLFKNKEVMRQQVKAQLNYTSRDKKTNDEVKRDLQKAYDSLGYPLKAKSTDIKEYYDVKEIRCVRIENGKMLKGYSII